MSHRAPNGAQNSIIDGAINMLLLRSKEQSTKYKEQKPHSYRSATSGSTFVARRAGT